MVCLSSFSKTWHSAVPAASAVYNKLLKTHHYNTVALTDIVLHFNEHGHYSLFQVSLAFAAQPCIKSAAVLCTLLKCVCTLVKNFCM